VLDSTAPQIRVISRRRIARTRPLVIEPRDKTSGLRSARLIIGGRTVARLVKGGRTVARLVKGERRIIYPPDASSAVERR
jgi:hypothetical protein